MVLLLVSVGGYYTADQLKRLQSEWNWPSVGIVWFWLVVLGAAWIAGPRLVPDGDTPV